MNRFAKAFVALCFSAGLTACGGGYSGYIIPVESELNPWVAQESDEILPQDGSAADADEGDYEDYEDDEGDEGAVTPAAAPTTPANPAAK